MKFDHIVVVNNPLDALGITLTREQLWLGLMLRAEEPQLFLPHIETCTLLTKSENGLARKLDFGSMQVSDIVKYFPLDRVEYHVPQQNEIPASSLTMSIVEESNGELQVRFLYEDGKHDAPGTMDAMYTEFRHSAYKEADHDTIRLIRRFVEEGRIG